MRDLIVGLGLVLVIEGVLWAAFPGLARKLLEAMSRAPENELRVGATVAIVVGVIIVWFARS